MLFSLIRDRNKSGNFLVQPRTYMLTLTRQRSTLNVWHWQAILS